MMALAGLGVAVTNPVASSAAAANPIGSFMLESSMRDSEDMQPRPVASNGAKGHMIDSYTATALPDCLISPFAYDFNGMCRMSDGSDHADLSAVPRDGPDPDLASRRTRWLAFTRGA
jgi:hypothetical protein